MHAFLEWPCDCRGTVWVRVGPQATHDPMPYAFGFPCKIKGKRAEASCTNRPPEGILPGYVTAAKRVLREAGYRLVWRRENHGKKREVKTRC